MMVPGKVLSIDHVQLAMPKGSENLARGFYRDMLGMKEIPKPEPLAGRLLVRVRRSASAPGR